MLSCFPRVCLCVSVMLSSSIAWSIEPMEFFEAKVRPLLIERCYECHSAESGESSGGLRLDSAAATRVGGSHGPAVVPGDVVASQLVRAIEYSDTDMQMPPDGKLGDEEIAILRRWVEIGAPDPRQETLESPASPLDRDPKTHWAFVPPVRKETRSNAPGSRDGIDDWAALRASEIGLDVAPEASRETLVRRLYFDMTGLPPSRDEIDRFANDRRPDSYVRLVDRLLASPEFAERFARHWLDVARYADTIGYTVGGAGRRLTGSERYRDWTIHAFANDMPYDEMIRHQLAGDRTDPSNADGNLDAMGFLTIGRRFLNGLDTIDDRIDVVSRGLLGLTVTCARCHDHKFDPIPTTDYYSLFGVMQSSRIPEDGPSPLALVDIDNPHDNHVLLRGQQGNHGPIAPRQYLTAFRAPEEPRFTTGSGRVDLAERIAAPENPLTARVMVNRIWGFLIGRPLVDTASDFGFRTEPPKVVEVLDNLAVDFASDWSVKRLIRRIVLSRIYRQSSEASESAILRDADNLYLARANRRRRDFESLRDSMLAKSSMLSRVVGGEPVEITTSDLVGRRTIYAMIDRQNLPALFRTFDFASPDGHSPGRYYTTVPQQSLYLLNSDQILSLARSTAANVQRETSMDEMEAARQLFVTVLGREPSATELKNVEEFLKKPTTMTAIVPDPRSLWSYSIATLDAANRITAVEPMPVYSDNRWQKESTFPSQTDAGYAFVSKDSGHAPRSLNLGVLRRWTSPISGMVELKAVVEHSNEAGDGIDAMIMINSEVIWGEKCHSGRRSLDSLQRHIAAGQTIDFVAMAGASDNSDSFRWTIQMTVHGDDGSSLVADSQADFSGPFESRAQEPLGRLEQLAQVLLMSNEFAFVD